MIDLENCKNIFDEYVTKYNMHHPIIFLKYNHTYRVMDNCSDLADSLNLNENDKKEAMLIGLLHDIGRFEQIKVYNTTYDKDSVDHANLGVEILTKNDFIAKFVSDEKVKQEVLIAIKNHNKRVIDNILDERTMLFCKIIRDADKIDILNIDIHEKKHIDKECHISKNVLNSILNYEAVNDLDIQNQLDLDIRHLAMIYDLNFDYSKSYIKSHYIVDEYIGRLIDANKQEKENLFLIRETLYKFLRGEK